MAAWIDGARPSSCRRARRHGSLSRDRRRRGHWRASTSRALHVTGPGPIAPAGPYPRPPPCRQAAIRASSHRRPSPCCPSLLQMLCNSYYSEGHCASEVWWKPGASTSPSMGVAVRRHAVEVEIEARQILAQAVGVVGAGAGRARRRTARGRRCDRASAAHTARPRPRAGCGRSGRARRRARRAVRIHRRLGSPACAHCRRKRAISSSTLDLDAAGVRERRHADDRGAEVAEVAGPRAPPGAWRRRGSVARASRLKVTHRPSRSRVAASSSKSRLGSMSSARSRGRQSDRSTGSGAPAGRRGSGPRAPRPAGRGWCRR